METCRKKKSSDGPKTVSPDVVTRACPCQSLRDICIKFIGHNIHLVESLVDFPEIIGRELFDAACSAMKFNRPCNKTASILDVFNEAYQGEVLNELNCFSQRHVTLETSLECIQTFVYLNKLDIDRCHIGDNHDLIAWISNLQRLTHLGLGDNALSYDGIRKLTSPLRMFGTTGPVGLQVMDLKYNPKITDTVIRYVTCFNKLEALDVTGCSITTNGVIKLKSLGFRVAEKEVTLFSGLCTTCGWAAEVVSSWARTPHERSESKSSSKDNTRPSTISFYSTHRRRLALASTVTKKCSPAPSKRLQLTRSVDNETGTSSAQDLCVPRVKTNRDLEKVNSKLPSRRQVKVISKIEIQKRLLESEEYDEKSTDCDIQSEILNKSSGGNQKQMLPQIMESPSIANQDILKGYLQNETTRGATKINTLWDVMKQW